MRTSVLVKTGELGGPEINVRACMYRVCMYVSCVCVCMYQVSSKSHSVRTQKVLMTHKNIYLYIYTYSYKCVCVCVCVYTGILEVAQRADAEGVDEAEEL